MGASCRLDRWKDAVHECIRAIAKAKGIIGAGVEERRLGPAVGEGPTKEGAGVFGGFNGGEIMAVESGAEIGILKNIILQHEWKSLSFVASRVLYALTRPVCSLVHGVSKGLKFASMILAAEGDRWITWMFI